MRSVTKTVTDSGNHNHIYFPGTGSCYTGCTTTVVKTGTGTGACDSSSTSFTNVDGSNLSYTVTIPTGWKLLIGASANIYTTTAVTNCNLAIADGGTVLTQMVLAASSSTTLGYQANLLWVIAGDGNSHTITLQYKTSNASDHVEILNAASGVPVMTFFLTPSN